MTQPTPPPQAPYPQAGPYGGHYPSPYGYYPWYPQVTLPPTPAERPTRPGRARIARIVLAGTIGLVTLGALALAALAPTFDRASERSPSAGLSLVYAAQLTSDATHWDTSSGCDVGDGGLHISGQSIATLCEFRPDAQQDFATSGFYMVAEVGPAAAVSSQQKPCIEVRAGEDLLTVAFDQQGGYGVKSGGVTTACSTSTSLVAASAFAWHTNGITPNRIALRYDASVSAITLYVNGQRVLTYSVRLEGPVTLGLGASANGEAVFTRFSLYA